MRNLKEILNTIVEGDVLAQLRTIPDDSIDVTVTSPPYNKRGKSYGWLVNNPIYTHSNDHLPEEEYQEWQIKVLDELYRVTKPGGSVFYNHKLRWEDGWLFHPITWLSRCKWHLRQELVWDRGLAANMRGYRFWQVDERIYWLYKPNGKSIVGREMLSKHAKLSSIWRLRPAPRMEDHPAPFPLELPVRILYSLCDKSQDNVVLDPFCGTGTTLVAAKLLGLPFIGIDLSPDYIEYARNRIEHAESEVHIFREEIERHAIDDTFSERKKRGTVSWPLRPKTENVSAANNGASIPTDETE